MPCLLWEILSTAGYPHPLLYEGFNFIEMGVQRYTVMMTIPQHPLNPHWPAIFT